MHSCVPRFTRVLNSPIQQTHVTAFTPTGEGARRVVEQWTGVWRTWGQPGAACGRPVDNAGPRLTSPPLSTGCGIAACTFPQAHHQRRYGRAGVCCGCRRDNSSVPRVWTPVRWRACGHDRSGATDSNAGRPWVRHRAGVANGQRARREEPAAAVTWLMRGWERCGQGAVLLLARGRGARTAPRATPERARSAVTRPSDPAAPTAGPGRPCVWARSTVGFGGRARRPAAWWGRWGAWCGQPFLMRLVSSVTWL